MPPVSVEDARLIAAAVAAQLAPAAVPGPTVARVLALYGESPEAQALAAWDTERGRIKQLVRVLGARDAAALTLVDVDDYRRARAEAAPATRNRELVRLTAALRWAAERSHLARYPLPRVRAEPEHNERSTYRSEDDVRAIVAVMVSRGRHALAALVATAFDGGLRRGEATPLRLDQLYVRDGVIALYAVDTKSKQDRMTPLSSWAADLIAAVGRPAGCPWAFPSSTGRPYNPRTVLRYYQEACDEAGIAAAAGETNHLHDLRAGFADTQVELGTPIPDIMRMAGWRDYRTMQRYLRRHARDIASAARARLEAHRRGPRRADASVNHPFPDVGATTPKMAESGN